MLGSIFIAESDLTKLQAIQSPDDFEHIGLDRMTTIDFAEVLAAANVNWTEGQPLINDEEGGWALFKVAEAGLRYALDHAADFPEECEADLGALAAFVQKNGASSIYELATF
jgi:hypothetical protein